MTSCRRPLRLSRAQLAQRPLPGANRAARYTRAGARLKRRATRRLSPEKEWWPLRFFFSVGLVVFEHVVGDAKALVSQGESREKVRLFLMARGVEQADAAAIVDALFRQRIEFVRGVGTKRCKQGALLILVPLTYQVAAYFGGFWHSLLFVWLSVVGMVGIFRVANAVPLVRHPEKYAGDIVRLM